ncbi:MAG: PilW family protein [Pseudomonadota bacterium]|jgi:type IV pilus assembly protein PilW
MMRPRPHEKGFSLVEIMVGMVIGMLGILVVMQVFAVSEAQKRTTTTGSDVQTIGALALYTIERDVRMAGYGFTMPEALGCTINRSFNGTTLPALTLAPVAIVNGAAGAPDTIEILASSKGSWSIPARITTDHPATATNFFLSSTLGMAVGDLLIAYEPGKDCTLLQITGIPSGNIQIHHQNTSPWNPPGGLNIFPPGGYGKGATLFNLGSMTDHVYSVDAGNNLQFADFNSTTNTSNTQALASDIANLQAQYGFDTRPGAQADARVDTWSDTMIDADGNGTAGSSGDLSRIYAVRLAVLARSPLREKARVNAMDDKDCDITTVAPAWTGGAFVVSGDPYWKCHRYKVFETVIPLRNLIWRQA